ncbi:MAG: hypothetical protein JWO67_2905 [Streptosporangiaceae bacterium]|nr:hypothetical protein [Streptosporangiaceae bacterium]
MNAPSPLDREPRCIRPPFSTRDDRFENVVTTDPTGWRRAVQLDRIAALLEPLDRIELSDREHAVVEWLAGWDIPTIAPVVRMLHAARAAVPLPAKPTGP